MSRLRAKTIDGWTVRIGKSNVEVRKGNKKVVADYAEVTGRTWAELEAGLPHENEYGGIDKGTAQAMIKPGHVRDWLKRMGLVSI